MAEELGKPLPFNRPQFECYYIPKYQGSSNSIVVFKCHHSLGDGISLMGLNLQQGGHYDIGKLINIPLPPWWYKYYL